MEITNITNIIFFLPILSPHIWRRYGSIIRDTDEGIFKK